MEFVDTVKEFVEATNKTMDNVKKQLGGLMFDEMDGDTLEMMKDMFNLCDLSLKITCQQARMIDEMNRKLDRLLEEKD